MIPLLIVAAARLFAIGMVNSVIAPTQTRSRIEKQLHGVIEVLTQSSYPLTDSVLRQMGGLANAEFVLTDAHGTPIASGSSVHTSQLAANHLTARTVDQVTLGPQVTLNSRPYFHSSVWIERRANLAGPSVLHILFSKDEFNSAWRASFLPPLLVGIGTLVCVGLVVHLVAGRLSATLCRLGNEVTRLAEGDFSEVGQPPGDDETRDLAVAINQTASRLADFESELRQTERLRTVSMLGAGLAHEMRNAATGCRLAVDLHAQDCHSKNADESLSVARRQLTMMESRLQQLLRMGQRTASVGSQTVDLAGLVSQSVALIKPAASHANVALSWNEPIKEVLVDGDSEMLGQAVINLLLNALDAAARSRAAGSDDAAVSVKLRRRGETSELVVADSGEGPTDASGDRLFEPFVTSKAEGVGLGLAVAKRVVESFGGKIGWTRDSGYTKFTIELPLAEVGVEHG